MGFNRGNFFSALAGLVVGVMLISVLPAGAGNGDDLVMGGVNYATDKTIQKTKSPFVFQTTKPGRPAAIFNVNSGAPIQVNSDVLVGNLNADLLDGLDSADLAAGSHDHDTDYLGIEATAADAELLDGMDSTVFASADHRHASNWVWDNSEATIPSTGDDLALLSVTVTNADECGNAATIHAYLAQADADITATAGTSGASSGVQASIGLNSLVVGDGTDSSYRTAKVWIDTDAPQHWALATSGMYAAVPPGEYTFRLLVKHDNELMTVKSFGGSLIVWDLGYWCSEP